MRDSAESTVDTGSRTAHTGAGMSAEVDGGGDSFTAACWDWSWKIRMTDSTDMMADKIPSNDRTINDRWLYLSDILMRAGFSRE